MKLRFYVDLHPGTDPKRWALHASTQPGEKISSMKRIAFDVTIPDSLLYSVDGHASEVSMPEIVK